jgi:hypothetical protein
MNLAEIRKTSITSIAATFGVQIPTHLPLFDRAELARSQNEVGGRICILNAVVAVCFGCPARIARTWISNNGLSKEVTKSELVFLEKQNLSKAEIENFKLFIESAWALAWTVNLTADLTYSYYCGNHFADLLPEVDSKEVNVDAFLQRCRLRPIEELAQAEDIAYCLDWAVVESARSKTKLNLPVRTYVVRKRRQALSWLFCREPWDEVPTDT